jgi:hypothetical protein
MGTRRRSEEIDPMKTNGYLVTLATCVLMLASHDRATATDSNAHETDVAAASSAMIPQPPLDKLKKLTRSRLAPESQRVDLAVPTFTHPTQVTNLLFPISSLHAALLVGRFEGKPWRAETTLLPDTRTVEWNGKKIEVLQSQFVAYLNGREVARANCGPTNHFIYASQPAFNVSTATGLVVQLTLGPVNALLTPGRNVLAIQAHNAEQPSSVSNPGLITLHLPTPEFKINAGLRTSGGAIFGPSAASFDFNDAAGGTTTHVNTNGVIADTATGPLAPGGWLATAARQCPPLKQSSRKSMTTNCLSCTSIFSTLRRE